MTPKRKVKFESLTVLTFSFYPTELHRGILQMQGSALLVYIKYSDVFIRVRDKLRCFFSFFFFFIFKQIKLIKSQICTAGDIKYI